MSQIDMASIMASLKEMAALSEEYQHSQEYQDEQQKLGKSATIIPTADATMQQGKRSGPSTSSVGNGGVTVTDTVSADELEHTMKLIGSSLPPNHPAVIFLRETPRRKFTQQLRAKLQSFEKNALWKEVPKDEYLQAIVFQLLQATLFDEHDLLNLQLDQFIQTPERDSDLDSSASSPTKMATDSPVDVKNTFLGLILSTVSNYRLGMNNSPDLGIIAADFSAPRGLAGENRGSRDVTTEVRKLVQTVQTTDYGFIVNFENLGRADPAPGIVKSLNVTCSIQGELKQISATEVNRIAFPITRKQPQPITPGHEDAMVDLFSAMFSSLTKNIETYGFNCTYKNKLIPPSAFLPLCIMQFHRPILSRLVQPITQFMKTLLKIPHPDVDTLGGTSNSSSANVQLALVKFFQQNPSCGPDLLPFLKFLLEIGGDPKLPVKISSVDERLFNIWVYFSSFVTIEKVQFLAKWLVDANVTQIYDPTYRIDFGDGCGRSTILAFAQRFQARHPNQTVFQIYYQIIEKLAQLSSPNTAPSASSSSSSTTSPTVQSFRLWLTNLLDTLPQQLMSARLLADLTKPFRSIASGSGSPAVSASMPVNDNLMVLSESARHDLHQTVTDLITLIRESSKELNFSEENVYGDILFHSILALPTHELIRFKAIETEFFQKIALLPPNIMYTKSELFNETRFFTDNSLQVGMVMTNQQNTGVVNANKIFPSFTPNLVKYEVTGIQFWQATNGAIPTVVELWDVNTMTVIGTSTITANKIQSNSFNIAQFDHGPIELTEVAHGRDGILVAQFFPPNCVPAPRIQFCESRFLLSSTSTFIEQSSRQPYRLEAATYHQWNAPVPQFPNHREENSVYFIAPVVKCTYMNDNYRSLSELRTTESEVGGSFNTLTGSFNTLTPEELFHHTLPSSSTTLVTTNGGGNQGLVAPSTLQPMFKSPIGFDASATPIELLFAHHSPCPINEFLYALYECVFTKALTTTARYPTASLIVDSGLIGQINFFYSQLWSRSDTVELATFLNLFAHFSITGPPPLHINHYTQDDLFTAWLRNGDTARIYEWISYYHNSTNSLWPTRNGIWRGESLLETANNLLHPSEIPPHGQDRILTDHLRTLDGQAKQKLQGIIIPYLTSQFNRWHDSFLPLTRMNLQNHLIADLSEIVLEYFLPFQSHKPLVAQSGTVSGTAPPPTISIKDTAEQFNCPPSITIVAPWTFRRQRPVHLSPAQDQTPALVRTSKHLLPDLPMEFAGETLCYFEVTIHSLDGPKLMSIGMCHPNYPMDKMVGWHQASFGYHGDDGQTFLAAGRPKNPNQPFGPLYGRGDTVGCGYDFNNGEAFFTLNGRFLGLASTPPQTDAWPGKRSGNNWPVFAAVGLRSSNAEFTINLGHSPFQFQLAWFGRCRLGLPSR